MDKGALLERVKLIAAKAAADSELELVNVEMAGTVRDLTVRVYIDKPGGVTLDDCSKVSREMEDVLDAEDVIPTRYVLEVSSPGIERQLYSLADFVRFSGQLVKVKTRSEINDQKTFVGNIQSVEGETIVIDDRTNGPSTLR